MTIHAPPRKKEDYQSPLGVIPYAEVEALAREMFPYWSGRHKYDCWQFDALMAAINKCIPGEYCPGVDLFEAAYMTCCLTRERRKDDTKARVAWEKRSDDFWNPMGGRGWAKR